MDDIVNLLKKLSAHVSNSIRVCMPGKIETYDFKKQQASVKIDMKELYDNGDTIDYPVVSGVPVVFMASGGASITMPVNRGDPCLLIYADRDMSNWLLGGSGQKPDSTRMHNLSDAIAIMGLFPFNSQARAENNTDVLIKYSGSKIVLKPNGIINIETTNDINVKAVENVIVNSKNTNISTTENTVINCKNLTVMSSENIVVNSKATTITTSEDLNINCKNMTATVSNKLNASCVDATITASNDINTKSIQFIHTGNMKITGNLELQGTVSGNNGAAISFTGGITNAGGVMKSNGIILETHTHSYSQAVAGSSPTAVIPGVTGVPV